MRPYYSSSSLTASAFEVYHEYNLLGYINHQVAFLCSYHKDNIIKPVYNVKRIALRELLRLNKYFSTTAFLFLFFYFVITLTVKNDDKNEFGKE